MASYLDFDNLGCYGLVLLSHSQVSSTQLLSANYRRKPSDAYVKSNTPTYRGGTSRENRCRSGYRVHKLISQTSPDRVYPMRIGKIPLHFQARLNEYVDW